MCVCPELSTKPHGPEPRSEAALPPGLEGREGPLLPTRVKLDCRDSLPAQAGLASVLPLPNRAHPDEVRVGAWFKAITTGEYSLSECPVPDLCPSLYKRALA